MASAPPYATDLRLRDGAGAGGTEPHPIVCSSRAPRRSSATRTSRPPASPVPRGAAACCCHRRRLLSPAAPPPAAAATCCRLLPCRLQTVQTAAAWLVQPKELLLRRRRRPPNVASGGKPTAHATLSCCYSARFRSADIEITSAPAGGPPISSSTISPHASVCTRRTCPGSTKHARSAGAAVAAAPRAQVASSSLMAVFTRDSTPGGDRSARAAATPAPAGSKFAFSAERARLQNGSSSSSAEQSSYTQRGIAARIPALHPRMTGGQPTSSPAPPVAPPLPSLAPPSPSLPPAAPSLPPLAGGTAAWRGFVPPGTGAAPAAGPLGTARHS
jgi:hypothetical protein